MTEAVEARRRDPDRRERILEAAADLVAERGYHEVGMTDIGAAAGITGSAIYRHFDGKSDVLATMFERVIDDLSPGAAKIAESDADPLEALRALIRGQIRFVVDDRRSRRFTITRSRTCRPRTGGGCAASSASTWRNGYTSWPRCGRARATRSCGRGCTRPSGRSSRCCAITAGWRPISSSA